MYKETEQQKRSMLSFQTKFSAKLELNLRPLYRPGCLAIWFFQCFLNYPIRHSLVKMTAFNGVYEKTSPKKGSLRFSIPFSDPHPQTCPLVSHTTRPQLPVASHQRVNAPAFCGSDALAAVISSWL